jgi:hypothetical protein
MPDSKNGNGVINEADFLNQLLSPKKLPKGYIGECIVKFVNESDEAYINPAEVFPLLKGKKVDTLYQGFNNARNDAELQSVISLTKMGEDLYIVHNERAQVRQQELELEQEVAGTEDEG